MTTKLSTNPADWIMAPIQSMIFKVLGFFWATIWGIGAVSSIDFDFIVSEFLLAHIFVVTIWPISFLSPFTFFAPFIAGYILWALIFDIHAPILLFIILSLTSSWVTYSQLNEFSWGGGWHSIPMLGLPIFLLGWVAMVKVKVTRNGVTTSRRPKS